MDHLNQLIHSLLEPLGWSAESSVRLIIAAVFGGLVGLEREIRGREAGFRTNMLVCVGSALVMLVSTRMAEMPWTAAGHYSINVDPGRIAYGVMAGIGFLGAGAIMKHGNAVRGLTTAAGLWCIAAIGLAAGIGQYMLSLAATLLVLAALWLLSFLDELIPRRRFRRLRIRCPWGEECIANITQSLRDEQIHVSDVSFHRVGDLSQVEIELWVSFLDARCFLNFQRKTGAGGPVEILSSEPM